MKIYEIWKNRHEPHLEICNNENETIDLINKFRAEILKIFSKKPDFVTFKKYYSHLIEEFIEHVLNTLREINLEDQKENKEAERIQKKILKVNLTKFNSKCISNNNQSIKLNEELRTVLQSQIQAQASVKYLLRCHSYQDNPQDNETEVNEAAFELASLNCSLGDQQKYKNVFATCGRHFISIIDAETGKVIRRFSDDNLIKNKKEVRLWHLILLEFNLIDIF